jgi:hypothetical protein
MNRVAGYPNPWYIEAYRIVMQCWEYQDLEDIKLIQSSPALSSVSLLKLADVSGTISVPIVKSEDVD